MKIVVEYPLPAQVWGDGDPEGVRQRAAENMKTAAKACRQFLDAKPTDLDFPAVVNGFTGSSIWHASYAFSPTGQDYLQKGHDDFGRRFLPIMEAFESSNVNLALDRCGGQRTTRLRTRTVPAPAIGASQICAAWRPRRRARDRGPAAEPAGALYCGTGTPGKDRRQQVLRSPSALSAGGHLWKPPRGSFAAAEHGPLDGAGRRLAATHL